MITSIRRNREARSYREWERSGYTPKDILIQIEDIQIAENWSILCRLLESLEDEDIAIYDSALQNKRFSSKLECAATLHRRLERYWQLESELLAKNFAEASTQTPRLRSEARKLQRGAFLETQQDAHLSPGEINLTFSDGPDPEKTERVLKALAREGVRANFFSIGMMARQAPELTQRIQGQHHVVGSHSMSHPQLNGISAGDAEENIREGQETLETILDQPVYFFRFPYGMYDEQLKQFVIQRGMITLDWGIDSKDWQLTNPTQLLRHLLSEIDRDHGGILLLHDIQEQTAIIMPFFLQELRKRELKTIVFVP